MEYRAEKIFDIIGTRSRERKNRIINYVIQLSYHFLWFFSLSIFTSVETQFVKGYLLLIVLFKNYRYLLYTYIFLSRDFDINDNDGK